MQLSNAAVHKFQKTVYAYYREHAARGLLWRRTQDPYRILVSEIMLQQTQRERVVPYYRAFIKRFPNFRSLAAAPNAAVLRAWQGLGYNRRAIALKKIAQLVVGRYHGKLPRELKILEQLPGVGSATAAAIAVFAFDHPAIYLDTNVRRVFIHHFFRRRRKVRDEEIIPLIEQALNRRDPRTWYYALLDYGSMLGKAVRNPNRRSAHYVRHAPFHGSSRELRGKIVAFLVQRGSATLEHLARELRTSHRAVRAAVAALIHDGVVRKKAARIAV